MVRNGKIFFVPFGKRRKRIKGSVTLEAAVVVPLFVIMVVNIVVAAFECHDQAIINCVGTKICMRAEYGYRSFDKDHSGKLDELSRLGTAYVGEKTIQKKDSVNVKASLLEVQALSASILRNDPVDYVWVSDAAEKLLQRAGEKEDGK
ncbi:MAG: hypothetical protein ACI4AQ_01600 [Lachnospiraceae bacterium]